MREKLVRGLIPGMDRRANGGRRFRTAERHEMPGLLRRKVAEEAEELIYAEPDEVLYEAADTIEAAYALAEEYGFSRAQVDAAREKKAADFGGFREGQVMRLD